MTKVPTPPTDAERIAELERMNRELSAENSRLTSQAMATTRAERELHKHQERLAQEKAMTFARTAMRVTYLRQSLPMVHTIIERLVHGHTPNWSELHQAAAEIRAAKETCEITGEAISAALDRVVQASRQDRAQWIEAASDDLRRLWHLGAAK